MPEQLPEPLFIGLVFGCGMGLGYGLCVLLDRLGDGAGWW